MGEVFLVYDPVCKRNVALKKIRDEYRENRAVRARFLKEARIASGLTHPSIIPIYAISLSPLYYTMTYVEGDTLKEILHKTRENPLHPIGSSILSLIRIFLNVCEAVAYSHAKGVLHRDLKSDNIIIGKYGEVLILDWGIASFLNEKKADKDLPIESIHEKTDLTKPGKLAGTISYMAPERVLGESASVYTDIYALGVMLYQILTLTLPFKRGGIEDFKKIVASEKLISPIERAPFRDIPLQLDQIAKKCLSASIQDRYSSVQDLIADLKSYAEGRPEWILKGVLDLNQEDDWKFKENILLAKHVAITRSTEIAEWVSIMISKKAFPGNLKLDANIKFGKKADGIGFLLSIPYESNHKDLDEGYCVWASAILEKKSGLMRSGLLVKEFPTPCLVQNKWHHIEIEKTENHLKLFINDQPIFTYSSHIPLYGNHIGLLFKDTNFEIKNIAIYSNNYNVTVNCLAVPDAFFSKKNYDSAMAEYHEIASSFPGRKEEREAIFRSGLTLLEKSKIQKVKREKLLLMERALDEFEKLHGGAGAPLEYLGKALVYECLNEAEEEAKCLELALRKFKGHPLLSMIKEHLSYRLYESSKQSRESAMRLMLIALRHAPEILINPDTDQLMKSMQKNLEPLYFSDEDGSPGSLAIKIAYWLGKKNTLLEIAKESPGSAFFALLDLGSLKESAEICPASPIFQSAQMAHSSLQKGARLFFQNAPKKLDKVSLRAITHILRLALLREKIPFVEEALKELKEYFILPKADLFLDAIEIQALLLLQKPQKAENIFQKYPAEYLKNETSPLYFLYGCSLFLTKGEHAARSFFSKSEPTAYPSPFSLGGLYIIGELDKVRLNSALFAEKKELYKQLFLYYHCANLQKEKKIYIKLALKAPK